jgi:predicted metal-dependent phosphoesterase TrpH
MRRRPSSTPAPPGKSRRREAADLHVHTTHSDGACSPCEVVVAAARVGLSALAITDHDTVSALAVARPEARYWGVDLIAGVELTCAHLGRELHLLGYFLREDEPGLVAAMASLRSGRLRRIEAMAARLGDLGLRVDLEALRRAFPRAVLGRRHLAVYLVRTGQVRGVREAFAEFLGDGRPACVAKPRLDIRHAIELIGRAGGVASRPSPIGWA